MPQRQSYLLAIAAAFALQCAHAQQSAEGESRVTVSPDNSPVNVIFDTDIWSDVDDALALAMLHALEDRGEIKLLAVTISTNDHWCASFVDLVNTFYGHRQIPIGINHQGMDVEVFRKRFPSMTWPVLHYTQYVSQQTRSDGSLVYPQHLSDQSSVKDAVPLLRKTLAAQSDHSVVIIQVGYSTNLARLLLSSSGADSSSNGLDLVARKVRLLSIMAGNFHESTLDGKPVPRGSPEFNMMADTPSAQILFSKWPTPIVVSGFEVGVNLLYPTDSIEHDFRYVEDHPIIDALHSSCEEMRAKGGQPCPRAQPTFDLTSVLYAARPDRSYFSLSQPGRVRVLDNGGSEFDEDRAGRDRYLMLSDSQRARALEAMVLLVSQPPKR
jgi:inosine-uridine nucleoside N-ribohydrolase